MNRIFPLLGLFILIASVNAFSSQKKTSIVIAPMAILANTNQFPMAQGVQTTIQTSLYDILSPIPQVKVVVVKQGEKPSNIIVQNKANYLIQGSIDFFIQSDRPMTRLELEIYRISPKNEENRLHRKVYEIDFAANRFDTLTKVTRDIFQVVFGYQRPLAWIELKNLRIGAESYTVSINGVIIDTVAKNTYSLSFPVLANVDYAITLRRPSDNKIVISDKIRLSPRQRKTYSYRAKGNLTILPMADAYSYKAYSYFLNGKPIEADKPIQNLAAGIEYHCEVFDAISNLVYRESFYLRDGENKRILPYQNTSDLPVIQLKEVLYAERWMEYRYIINGKTEVAPSFVSNLYPNMKYEVLVLDRNNKRIHSETLRLSQNELAIVSPADAYKTFTFGLFYRIEELIFGVSFELLGGRYFWIGASIGASYFYSKQEKMDLFYFFPYAEIGYYFFNDLKYDFRMGVGICAKYNYLNFPRDTDEATNPFISNRYFGVGAFTTVEYQYFYFKPAIYLDFNNNFILKYGFTFGTKF